MTNSDRTAPPSKPANPRFGISRRNLLKGATLGGAAVLFTPNIIRAQAGGKVFVRTSGGSYQDALAAGTWKAFTAKTGIEVVPVPANTAKLLAMAEAGSGELDIAEGNATAIVTLDKKGALAEIDYSKFQYTDPKNLSVATKTYCGYAVFAEALIYNTQAFPTKHPTNWKEFWDVKAFPGPRMLQDAKAISPNLEFALIADGVPVDKLYPLDVDRAFTKLKEIKPNVIKFYDTGALGASLLAEKTAVLGSLWTNRVEVLKKDGAPVAVEWNQAMRLKEFSAILKSAPNKDNALRLIDFASSPEPMAKTLPVIGLSPDNIKAFDYIDPKEAETLPTSPQNIKVGFDQDAAWWIDNLAKVGARWQEFLLT